MDTLRCLLKGDKGKLVVYRLEVIKITDNDVLKSSGLAEYPILRYPENMDDRVEGLVLEITGNELLQYDKYGVDDYTRVMDEFNS